MMKIRLFCLLVFLVLCFPLKVLSYKVSVVRVKGSVLVKLPGKDWLPARRWLSLPLEAEVKTLDHSSVDLLFEKKALVRLKENGHLSLKILSEKVKKIFAGRSPKKGTLILLDQGRLYLLVSPKYPEKPFVVETPIGMAGVSGTRFVVDVVSPEECLVAVWKGEVLVWSKYQRRLFRLKEKEFGRLFLKGPLFKPSPLSPKLEKNYREVEKLVLPGGVSWRLRRPGSRYEGLFTRGFAPQEDLKEKESFYWDLRSWTKTRPETSPSPETTQPKGEKSSTRSGENFPKTPSSMMGSEPMMSPSKPKNPVPENREPSLREGMGPHEIMNSSSPAKGSSSFSRHPSKIGSQPRLPEGGNTSPHPRFDSSSPVPEGHRGPSRQR